MFSLPIQSFCFLWLQKFFVEALSFFFHHFECAPFTKLRFFVNFQLSWKERKMKAKMFIGMHPKYNSFSTSIFHLKQMPKNCFFMNGYLHSSITLSFLSDYLLKSLAYTFKTLVFKKVYLILNFDENN